MEFLQLFTKTPNHKRFGYVLNHFDSKGEGWFKPLLNTVALQADASSTMLRSIITLIVTLGLVAFLEFGRMALVGVPLVFITFCLYLNFRKFRR